MPIDQILRPSATVTNIDSEIGGSGAATVWEALKRMSPTILDKQNWVQLATIPITGDSYVIVDVDDLSPALLATQRISQVRVKAYAKSSAAGTVRFHGTLRESGGSETDSFFKNTDLGDSGQVITGNWVKAKPSGGEWTAAIVNAMKLRLRDTHGGGAFPIVYYAQIELQIQQAAQSTVIYPTSSTRIDPGFQFKASWLAEAAGDAPFEYQLKVFSKAIAEDPSFDANTSTAVYDSGIDPITTGTEHTVPAALLAYGTDYYIYVRTSTIFNGPTPGEEWWGPWGGQLFRTGSIPVVTVTSPSGVQATARPFVGATYADADGKPADKYLIRIFERPISGSWAGFNPDFFPAGVLQVSYEQIGGAGVLNQVPAPQYILNGKNYRAYVKAYPVNFTAQPQNFIEFTTSWTPPTTPTLTAIADTLDPSRLILTMKNNHNHASARITVERSIDGVTWTRVRGIDALNIGYNVNVDHYDFEAPVRQFVSYRAFVVSTESGAPTQSNFATSSTGYTPKVNYLKDPLDPARNMHVVTTGQFLEKSNRRARAFYEPIGRELPLAFRGAAKGDRFQVQFIARTVQEEAALEKLLDSNRTLWFQTAAHDWYVDVDSDYNTSEYMWNYLHNDDAHPSRIYTVTFVEVDAP